MMINCYTSNSIFIAVLFAAVKSVFFSLSGILSKK